jgi:hypothetical protein
MLKKLLSIAFTGLLVQTQAATFYVATSGNDSNQGTFEQPWKSIQKGFNQLSPGDTLYIRGGTYSPTGKVSDGNISAAMVRGKKGTAAKMFCVFAYPGELPVIDCRNMTDPDFSRAGIMLTGCDYWYIRGIQITRADQCQGPIVRRARGFLIQSGNFNRIENISAYENGGPGFEMRDLSEGNIFLNCDAFNNYDPYTDTPGDDADGFDIGFIAARPGNDRVNTLSGCRSWGNSDDGYDMFQQAGFRGSYILKNCWAWKNGYRPDGKKTAGDGNGFKLGADNSYPTDLRIRRTLCNCIACSNRQRGFSQESANVKMIFYNNSAFFNGSWGFSFYKYDLPDILKNNLSYRNKEGAIENQGINRVHDHNSWDSRVMVSDADFSGLDPAELSKPRENDGSLPVIKSFHPARGSDLIDAGTDTGNPYTGKAPDIGAFETD